MSNWENNPDEFNKSDFLKYEGTPTDVWVSAKLDYKAESRSISVYQVFPNDGKHVSSISYTDDIMVISECACNPMYEAVGDGVIVVHRSDELKPDKEAINACIADNALAPIFKSSNDET